VLEPGGEPDLALEAVGAEGGGELGVEHLERDRPVVLEIVGEEDRGHASAAELALEGVQPAQSVLKLRGQIGQWSLSQGGIRVSRIPPAREGANPRSGRYSLSYGSTQLCREWR
jgi:hypothetical protein